MSNFIHKPGTGSLFPNQFKTKDNQPDLTGVMVMSRDCKAGEKVKEINELGLLDYVIDTLLGAHCNETEC